MMMRLTGMVSVLALATSAQAQEMYGGVSYGWTSVEDAGVEVTASTLFGAYGMDYGQLDFYVAGSQTTYETDPATIEVDETAASFAVGYEFIPSLRADLSYATLELSALGISEDASVIEAGLSYEMSGFFGRVSYADVDEDSDTLESITSVTLGYEIDANSNLALSIHDIKDSADVIDEFVYIGSLDYERDEFTVTADYVSFEQDSVDLSLLALSGSYRVTPAFQIRASYADGDLDGLDADITSIGVGYGVSGGVEVFADVSRWKSEGFEADGFSAGIKYTFGDVPVRNETTVTRISDPLSFITGGGL